MSSVFSKIIAGDIPGRFVWKDDDVVAFLTAAPITEGHALVVPREEIDSWTDAPRELLTKVMDVARTVGKAQEAAFAPQRIGLLAEGFEVRHLHLHVWPAFSASDFEVHAVDRHPDPAKMDAAAEKIRAALRDAGHAEFVPEA